MTDKQNKHLETYLGWRYLGTNDRKAENPRQVIAKNNALLDEALMCPEDNGKLWSLNHYWHNCFGYSKLYPPFDNSCVCGREKPRYVSYFMNPVDQEMVALGPSCTRKLMDLFKERCLPSPKSKPCLRCNMYHNRTKSDICNECEVIVGRSYWCVRCPNFVMGETIKVPCSVCKKGWDFKRHPCYPNQVYETRCTHNKVSCFECFSIHYEHEEHTCGKSEFCLKCKKEYDTSFNHECKIGSYLCLYCLRYVSNGTYTLPCGYCKTRYLRHLHTCGGQDSDVEPRLSCVNLCVCRSFCKVCFGKLDPLKTHECQPFLELLGEKVSFGGYKDWPIVEVMFNHQAYYNSYIKKRHPPSKYMYHIKWLVDEGLCSKEAIITKAQAMAFKSSIKRLGKRQGTNSWVLCDKCNMKVSGDYYYRKCSKCSVVKGYAHLCDGIVKKDKPCKCSNP